MTSNIMRTKDIQTSPSAAHLAGRPAGRTEAADSVAAAAAADLAAVAADSADLARCIRRFARSAARTLRCPSDLAATDPSIAATATASSATAAEQEEEEEEEDGLPSATKPSKCPID